MNTLSRRTFLASTSVAALGLPALRAAAQRPQPAGDFPGDSHRGVVCIGSANGLRSTTRAIELMREGFDPADCIVQGVRIVEDDPNDDSVGYGGLPNADGIVELDASVMHGPTHKSGAVAGIRNIKNPAMVALAVLRRTDHCLLVGEGALRFARSMGFREENLLTEKARKEWLAWRENMSHDDDWLNDDEKDPPLGKTWDSLPWQDGAGAPPEDPNAPRMNDGPQFVPGSTPRTQGKPFITEVTGTVHCSILTPSGDIASCTSTSGLNWKIPGRVGDSPIIGAGNYCDNNVGAAGCTGRGEAAIVNLCAATMVSLMERGMLPREACLEAAKRVVDRLKEKRLRRPDGKPTFDLKFYALRKDGAYGGASFFSGANFAVHDGTEAKLVEIPSLFPR